MFDIYAFWLRVEKASSRAEYRELSAEFARETQGRTLTEGEFSVKIYLEARI